LTIREVLLLLGMLLAFTAASYSDPYPTTDTATGEASWYDDGPGLYAAVHSYRFGDPRYSVEVCRADNDEVCVTVTVRDHMANRERVVDLSPAAFSRLAPLSQGVVQVTVGPPIIPLPATDTP
jgi:rare lipoprotein A (peptidoglycan hydrolase)